MNMSIQEWGHLINDIYQPFKDTLRLCAEFGLNRADEPIRSLKYLEEAIKTGFFESIDLYGDELVRPIQAFSDIYRLAKLSKMKLKAHIGETGSAQDVMEGVELLSLDSVQHGVSASRDENVMRFLRERGTTLNVCPSSNVSLGICESIRKHHIRTLFDNGIRVTINSDDFMIFASGVADEIYSLYRNKVFNIEELAEIIDNGLSESCPIYYRV